MVTGGSSGLGRATAERLVAMGAQVVIVDLASSEGAQAAEEIGALFVAADVTDEAAVAQAVAAAQGLGDLRMAVSCAGIGPAKKTLSRGGPMPLDFFAKVVSVNLVGTFNVVRLAAAAMADTEPVDGERGVIVNTASLAAYDGQIGQVAYSASKAGVAGMTLPLARDLSGSLIRVMTIAPGIFLTPMLLSLPQQAQDSLGASVPHPARLGAPSEYAGLVAHIVDNPMLNGEVIRLDGALRLPPR